MYKFIYLTAASPEEAEKIGSSLVGEKLAACANFFPIRSIYTWKGALQKDNETAMFLKTKSSLVDSAVKRIKELHSYEVPCIVSIPIEKGLTEYLKWVDESTKG